MIREGADILDIGGESSRPGAPTLSVDEEWARLEPVLHDAVSLGVPISVDTCKPEVMRRALDVGVNEFASKPLQADDLQLAEAILSL